jgi:alkanesulfonate monooxygenase SsuD/methylene tetrahydromethanopterin reductase-like flavin-dependent oxidoreductase (luciferase family)
MKLGLFMMPVHPPEKDRTQCFEEDLELIVRADELGLAEAWVGQHHSVPWEPIPSNDVFIANAMARTKNIHFGTGVTLVPLHHPVNIAVRLALLDHLSRGRLYCGFGQSGIRTDLSLFDLPNDPKTLGLMTVEGIDMVLKLWQSEPPFDFKGDYWRIRVDEPDPTIPSGLILKPYQKPHPPLAMSIVKGASLAARMAGQRGYIPVSTNLVPVSTLVEHWQTYCAGAAEAGRPAPERAVWRVSRNILVGDNHEATLEHALSGSFAGSFDYLIRLLGPGRLELLKDDPDLPDEAVTPEYAVRNIAIVGDVAHCVERLHEVYRQTGGFGTLLMIGHDWDDKARWLRSLELLANEVAPALSVRVAGEQGSRVARSQSSKVAREQGSRDAGEQGSRGAREQG